MSTELYQQINALNEKCHDLQSQIFEQNQIIVAKSATIEHLQSLRQSSIKQLDEALLSLDMQRAELAEKRAEIRRLNIEVECFTSVNKILDKENTELIEKIEKLTAEIDKRREMMNRMNCNYATELQKNTELQKQVDKLKQRLNAIYGKKSEACNLVVKEKQIVKDTAKEILQYMETLKVEEDGRHEWRDEHNRCIERISCKIHQKFVNGVEVE